jgi:uncharacterized protein
MQAIYNTVMNIKGEKKPDDSPCIGVCSTTYGDDVCLGCKRTFDEVHQWNQMTKEQKIAINHRLQLVADVLKE